MAYLSISTRDGVQRVPLTQARLRIGRLSSNDIILPYQQISREHAELQHNADAWWISDLQSTNGLQVNGRLITRYPLQPGERVCLAPGIAIWLTADDDALSALATTQMPTPGQAAQPVASREVSGLVPTTEVPPLRLQRAVPPRSAQPDATPDRMAAPPVHAAADSQVQHSGQWTPPTRATTWAGERPPEGSTSPDRSAPRGGSTDGPPEGDLFRRSRTRPAYQSGLPGNQPPTDISRNATPPLHICQTCGQRTAADALACQFCRSPISRPCIRCGMSLLPSQERCARCQSPNAAFVQPAR